MMFTQKVVGDGSMSKRKTKSRAAKQSNRHTKSKNGVGSRKPQRTSKQRQLLDQAVHYHQAGNLSRAEELYRKVLVKNPQQPDALHLLGTLAQQVGQNDRAVALITQALTAKPDCAEAHFNLGVALHALGQFQEALASYSTALDIDPNQAAAHGKIGNIQQELGQLEDAVVSYRQVLALEPKHPVAHNNLGNTLWKLGQHEEAIASYRTAIAIRPQQAMAHSNLGSLLKEQGRMAEAVASHRRAIALSPQEDQFWNSFAECLKFASFTGTEDEGLWQDLLNLLERPSVRPRNLVLPILSALRQHDAFAKLLDWANSEPLKNEWGYARAAETLSAIPLFLRLMELSPIHDVQVEVLLTLLRRKMLQGGLANQQQVGPFFIALALHCFVNEYVFYESAEETEILDDLQRRLTTRLENKQDILAHEVVALAAYRPLSQLPCARALRERAWPGDINRLLVQQIDEPEQELALRAAIASPTSLADAVSQTVRDQYEESPYPRWIKTQIHSQARTIANCLRSVLPTVDLGDYQDLENPQVLIAGCGTGQQALWAASRYWNSSVTAVDLSLSSLAYAVRKTRELGVTNIEYLQADILELGSLQREFDLIECHGVLHHLEDPLAGWQVLVDMLRPQGFMNIGLYSEMARRPVVQSRAEIAERGITASAAGIRQYRQDLFSADCDSEISKLFTFRDFYSLSDCRDLLFHVQEHRFTLVQIEAALQSLGLKFLGFEMVDPRVFRKFEADHVSTKQAFLSLPLWHQFELTHPDTFIGMYQFWCQKI